MGLYMSPIEFRRAVLRDFSAILRLQAANFVGNLSVEDRQGGFLSAQFTPEQIAEMASDIGIIIASGQDFVLGFLCAFRHDFNHQSPVVDMMIQQIDKVQYRGKPLSSYRFFIYGPVCIDRSQRGRGLLQGLYETLKKEVAGQFDVGIGFVAKDNPHSLRAHVDRLDMSQVGEFELNGNSYVILAFSVPSEMP
jgi:hypothetical protein